MSRAFGPMLPPPAECCNDPHLTVQRVIPWGCGGGACVDGCPSDYRRPPVTHARDTIHVPPGAAGTRVYLDDGTGEGYAFPMPADCIRVRLRRKGHECFCLDLMVVSARYDGSMEIRWPLEWNGMPPGYYEAEIQFKIGPRYESGGWLLFHKDRTARALPTGTETVHYRPHPRTVSHCAPGDDISWTDNTPVPDCGNDCEDC